MTPQVDHAELGRTTYEANSKQFDIHPFFARAAKWDELPDETKTHYATVERTVTAPLLSEIEGLKRQRDELHETTNRYLARARSAEDALRTQAPDSWRPDREAVARIVDPETFALISHYSSIERFDGKSPAEREAEVFKGYPYLKRGRDIAYADADAILALRPQTAESGK